MNASFNQLLTATGMYVALTHLIVLLTFVSVVSLLTLISVASVVALIAMMAFSPLSVALVYMAPSSCRKAGCEFTMSDPGPSSTLACRLGWAIGLFHEGRRQRSRCNKFRQRIDTRCIHRACGIFDMFYGNTQSYRVLYAPPRHVPG